jgi:uncharacterized protein
VNEPEATRRDRHGRSRYRAPLVSERTARNSGMTEFEQIVSTACEYMRREWPVELQSLNWRVEEMPQLPADSTHVPRFKLNHDTMTLTIYRGPLLRLTHHSRTDYTDERIHIEQEVFSAVSELLGRDPWR